MTDMQTLPTLPLRDIIVFPHMVVPLFVGRKKSIAALEDVMRDEKRIFLLSQKKSNVDDPIADDLHETGCIARILQLLKLPDGTVRVLVEGETRASVNELRDDKAFIEADITVLDDVIKDAKHVDLLAKALDDKFENYVKLNKKLTEDVANSAKLEDGAAKVSDVIAVHLTIKQADKQALLAEVDVEKRLEMILGHIEGETSILKVEKKIRGRVKRQMEKTQREYYLNEQMKAINKELGNDDKSEIDEINERIADVKLSKEAKTKLKAEVKKLKDMSPMSAEANVSRNYIDWMLSVPWGKKKRIQTNLDKAQVVGPPGVGKTSLGKSVARATGREFVRVSLGGVRDTSEIRGHRRTYIGSMPGRIIQSMKKAKSTNPLFLLDEIDKMGMDHRGDPSAALLEVLDPEQNGTFNDHYLDVDYDLSDVLFITTANSLNMPQPLLDRMEIIRIPGYTEDEKVEIAQRHLQPDMVKDHGLKDGEFKVDEAALRDIIRYYTREAGVRSFKREIAGLGRKALRKIVSGDTKSVHVKTDNLKDFLGVQKFRFGETDKVDQVGVVTGLAWTSVGGDLLTIESVSMPGKGRMTVTGNLKDVMKESISAAKSYVQSRAPDFGISPKRFQSTDIHVHVPEGATPKDGPSAGIAMVTAMVSVLTDIPVRKDIAMTGEVTLRGRVLPIGGLKEKLLAALRGGVKTVLIPIDNAKDLDDIPENVKSALEIIPVSTVDEVLKAALTRKMSKIEWTEQDEAALSGIILGEKVDVAPRPSH